MVLSSDGNRLQRHCGGETAQSLITGVAEPLINGVESTLIGSGMLDNEARVVGAAGDCL